MADFEAWQAYATTEHVNMFTKTVSKRAKANNIQKLYTTKPLTPERPYLRIGRSDPMGPAEEIGSKEAPPLRDPVPLPPIERWPVWVGVQTTIDRTAQAHRNTETMIALGQHQADSMWTALMLKLHQPFYDGDQAGTPFRTEDGVPLWSANHTLPLGRQFRTIAGTGINLEFSYDNLIDTIIDLRLNHTDALGFPTNYWRGRIGLLYGDRLWRQVEEIFGTMKGEPYTPDNTKNVVHELNITRFHTQWLFNQEWGLVDLDNADLLIGEFFPMQTYADTVWGIRNRRSMAIAYYQNMIPHGRGLFFSRGPAEE